MQNIPKGFCQCGCGQRTNLATITAKRYGIRKGEPRRFIHNHHGRKPGIPYEVIDRGYRTPCHIWKHAIHHSGYGAKQSNGTSRPAHLVLWEEVNGPVPEKLQLDHLCKQKDCVRLDHLEPVTGSVNCKRSHAPGTHKRTLMRNRTA